MDNGLAMLRADRTHCVAAEQRYGLWPWSISGRAMERWVNGRNVENEKVPGALIGLACQEGQK